MATILVKGVSEDTLKRLKKLKVELECGTWAELLDKLARSDLAVTLNKEEVSEMRQGVSEFITLANRVSKKWKGPPTIVEEMRVSRHHE